MNVTNMDVIATMSDDDIFNSIAKLEEQRKTNKNTKHFEIEISYFQRELGLRQQRKSLNRTSSSN